MATPTYTPLATTTLASSASSVTFSSIDQSYGDLVLVISGTTASATTPIMRFNSDSGSNYSWVRMDGDGSNDTSASGTYTGASFGRIGTAQSVIIAQIMDYSATDKHTTILSRGNLPNDRTRAMATRWANTSAITSAEVIADATTFDTGTTLSLYGIAK